VLTYERLFGPGGGRGGDDVRPLRTIIGKLRCTLGDDADEPTYSLTEPRVGYRMPEVPREGQRPD